MELRRSILLVLLSVAQMIGARPAHGEEFYAAQLRLGFEAMAAGEPSRAAEHCRIASFGLMDQPAQLSSSLVCLALAASAADRPAELGAALARFLEVETRFAPYAEAPVADAFRRSFDALLLASVDRERLAAIPSLGTVGGSQRAPLLSDTATQRQSDTATQPREAATQRRSDTATQPREAATQRQSDTVAEQATAPPPVVVVDRVEVEMVTEAPVVTTPEPVAEPVAETAAPEPVADSEADGVLIEARRLIVRERPAEAAKIVYRQLTKTPARRDLRLTLLEAATLNKDWRTAVAQADLIQPFVTGEEISMFYAAVALFESGRRSDARRLAERAREFVPKTEYVRYYTKRIEAME